MLADPTPVGYLRAVDEAELVRQLLDWTRKLSNDEIRTVLHCQRHWSLFEVGRWSHRTMK